MCFLMYALQNHVDIHPWAPCFTAVEHEIGIKYEEVKNTKKLPHPNNQKWKHYNTIKVTHKK